MARQVWIADGVQSSLKAGWRGLGRHWHCGGTAEQNTVMQRSSERVLNAWRHGGYSRYWTPRLFNANLKGAKGIDNRGAATRSPPAAHHSP
jgi:hypothetical protein